MVVAFGFAFFGLMFFAEVTTARFFAMEGIVGHEFAHEDEVFQTECLFEFHVYAFLAAGHEEFFVERLAHLFEEVEGFFETFLGATHTHILPHDVAEFFVERVDRTLTTDVEEAVDATLHILLCGFKFGEVGREAGHGDLVGQIVLDGVGEHEVTIGKTLHEGRSTEAVGTVVGEVTFTDGEQTLDGGHQFVVYPNATHRVVDGGEDLHRSVVGAFVGDFFVHVEEVAVACFDFVTTKVLDGL